MDERGRFVEACGRPVRPGALGWRVFGSSPRFGKDARDWMAQVVCRHDSDIDPAEVAVVVSELFANALVHGPAGGRVLVGHCLGAGVRIVVCDEGGQTVPQLRSPGQHEEGGRGLRVVDTIASAWGHFRSGPVQVVWCDLGEQLDPAAGRQAWRWLAAVLGEAFRAAGHALPVG
jgi:serine/threonine-protein kinase RsbW